jgi:mono/diheme cytochrome c family protein
MIRLVMIAASLLAAGTAAFAQSPVERGSYLVNGVLTCGNCHTPRAKGGVFDKAKAFSGGPQTFETAAYTVKGSNITPHQQTGIGAWSDSDIKRALTEGRRPNGVQLAPVMPYAFYKVFTERDLNAIVAYLRSVPAVENQVQTPVYRAELHTETPPGADKQMTAAEMTDAVRRGFYLASIGHCMECHSPETGDHRIDFSRLGKGGRQFKGPWGLSVSRNITSHMTSGLGAWSDSEIKTAITKGVRKDGGKLKPPMGFELYATMTDFDLSAIVAYLRTVPPQE